MADKKATKDDAEDADEEKKEGAEVEPSAGDAALAKKKKKRKLMIIVLAVVVLAAGGGAGLYFSGMLGGKADTEAAGKKTKKKKEAGEHGTTGSSTKSVKQNLNDWIPGPVPQSDASDVSYFNLPEFLVNLNTGGKQTSFIKMKVTLETPSADDLDAIDGYMPRITDSFNTYLREMRSSDLAGSAGLYRLREELLLRVNKTVYPSKVNDILFRELIIQ
jgi:flagellar FliL protein